MTNLSDELRTIADTVETNGGWHIAAVKVRAAAEEIDQLRADISQAYDLRDKAEGRYCTALGEIEGAHHDIDRLMAACTAEANEVERLRAHLRDIGSLATPEDSADDERQFARMREMVMAALSGSHEPLLVASRDAEHCDYPDCEHHWELVVDWALAAMKKLHESAEPDTDHPEIPAVIPAGAFRAFVDEHARLMRIRASAPQGASRDASSEPCEQLDAGKTKLAIAMLDRFCDGRLQTAEGTHTSLLGPRDQLLQEADWFDHAAKVLRSSLR